jgi:hypothetical protein
MAIICSQKHCPRSVYVPERTGSRLANTRSKSKKTGDRRFCDEVEVSPDRPFEKAKTKAKKETGGKKLRGYQKDEKLIEVGD